MQTVRCIIKKPCASRGYVDLSLGQPSISFPHHNADRSHRKKPAISLDASLRPTRSSQILPGGGHPLLKKTERKKTPKKMKSSKSLAVEKQPTVPLYLPENSRDDSRSRVSARGSGSIERLSSQLFDGKERRKRHRLSVEIGSPYPLPTIVTKERGRRDSHRMYTPRTEDMTRTHTMSSTRETVIRGGNSSPPTESRERERERGSSGNSPTPPPFMARGACLHSSARTVPEQIDLEREKEKEKGRMMLGSSDSGELLTEYEDEGGASRSRRKLLSCERCGVLENGIIDLNDKVDNLSKELEVLKKEIDEMKQLGIRKGNAPDRDESKRDLQGASANARDPPDDWYSRSQSFLESKVTSIWKSFDVLWETIIVHFFMVLTHFIQNAFRATFGKILTFIYHRIVEFNWEATSLVLFTYFMKGGFVIVSFFTRWGAYAYNSLFGDDDDLRPFENSSGSALEGGGGERRKGRRGRGRHHHHRTRYMSPSPSPPPSYDGGEGHSLERVHSLTARETLSKDNKKVHFDFPRRKKKKINKSYRDERDRENVWSGPMYGMMTTDHTSNAL